MVNSRSEKNLSLDEYISEYAPGHNVSTSEKISMTGHLQKYEWALSILADKQISGDIFDIGCGYGFGTNELAMWSDNLVVGMDFNYNVLVYAHKQYNRSNLCFSVTDATCIPLPSAFFNIITSFELIEHLSELQVDMYLAEIRRVLKMDGVCFISTPNRIYREMMGYEMYPYHEKEYTPEELEAVLLQHFDKVQIFGQRYMKQSLRGMEGLIGASNFVQLKKIIPTSIKRKISVLFGWDKDVDRNWVVSQDSLESAWGLLAICEKVK